MPRIAQTVNVFPMIKHQLKNISKIVFYLIGGLIILATVSVKNVSASINFSDCPSPGTICFGNNRNIEYIRGNLPIIISAPHGGYLTPAQIPSRTSGSCGGGSIITARDIGSQEYTREVADLIHQSTGRWPHIIINHLHRSRLDANRPISSAACGSSLAEEAWREFHSAIDFAKGLSTNQCGRGHYFDFHTNWHNNANEQYVEMGNLLVASQLRFSDLHLDTGLCGGASCVNESSLRSLVRNEGVTLSQALRGVNSLGTILQRRGFRSTPSQQIPSPTGRFFNGGYNTGHHGSKYGGVIDGTQVETNLYMINSASGVTSYSRSLAPSILDFLNANYQNFDLRDTDRNGIICQVSRVTSSPSPTPPRAGSVTPPPGSSPTPPGGQLPTPTPVRGTYNFPLAQLFDFSPRLSDLESVFENVVRGVLGFTLIILFIMIIIGGYKYLTSGGDPKSLESAKATLTYAIAGVLLISLSYLILILIQETTGTNITNFRLVVP